MDTGARAATGELPLACTLSPNDGAARLSRWQLLVEKSPPRAQLSGHTLEVRWRLEARAKDELDALVAAERRCCSFVSWCVHSDGADTVLHVTGDESRPGDLAPIARLFGAADSKPALAANGPLLRPPRRPYGVLTVINSDSL